MSTICKLDPAVRSRRAIRRAIRNRFAALAEAFRVTGQLEGYFAYSALLSVLSKVTDHKRFLSIVMSAGNQAQETASELT